MTAIFKSLPPRAQFLLPYLVLAAAVFIAYANTYGNEFLFDDGIIITRNAYLQSWGTLGNLLTESTTAGAHIAGGFYRPVQMLLYFLITQLFGESTAAFHFLNIALHAANACLVYALGCKLFPPETGHTHGANGGVPLPLREGLGEVYKKEKGKGKNTPHLTSPSRGEEQNHPHWPSFLAALLWALHPIHTEAVTYISATADPLFVFFGLLGLIILLPDFTLRKIILVTPVFALALLSKETAVVFPLLAMVTLYYVSPERLKAKTYLRTWPLWLIAALYLFWRLNSTAFDGPETYQRLYQLPAYHNLKLYADHFTLRLYTFFATLPAYLGLLLYPHGLHMERDFTIFADFWTAPVIEGALLCLAAAAWIVFARGRRGLPLGWGLLWFGAAHAPDTGLFVAGNALFLEHWMYLPTVGLCLGGAESLGRVLADKPQNLKRTAAALALAASFALGTATFVQNRVWLNPVTFYMHIFKYGGDSARAHNNLALAYMDRHEYEKAIAEFNKAIAMSDTYAETQHNLALCLLDLPDQKQHIPEAIAHLNRALEIDPDFVRSYFALAQIYAYLGDKAKAASYWQHGQELLNGSGSP